MLFTLSGLGCSSDPGGDDDGGVTTNQSSSGPPTSTDDETGPTQPGDGDGDGDSGDGDCFEAPDPCLTFVNCIAALVPSQAELVADQYGEDGSCWCGTDQEAMDCYSTCITELDNALTTNPTEPACHESSCTLAELDPTQPYGPIQAGNCPDHAGQPQQPFMNLLGLPGGYCAPPCTDIGDCPDHPQTSAPGTCYTELENQTYCALRCYVDSTWLGGNQCQCGARCQPEGGQDGEGNLRGICTFE